ncbi:MAG: D-Ala-D-Ala carboxypeptidase family metallohydrolase [Porphyromonas sp.]|nr:D-Ala-D-Ala carboxypeptidase family metallohydrolase [Porphyromonas sp.]
MNPVLLAKLDELRERLGRPVIVSSGYRCPVHNRNVGGVYNSQHVNGTAADIYCPGVAVGELASAARAVGFDGIGVYYFEGFVHVDCRDGGRRPGYYTWEG